jgi:hypothetical protein
METCCFTAMIEWLPSRFVRRPGGRRFASGNRKKHDHRAAKVSGKTRRALPGLLVGYGVSWRKSTLAKKGTQVVEPLASYNVHSQLQQDFNERNSSIILTSVNHRDLEGMRTGFYSTALIRAACGAPLEGTAPAHMLSLQPGARLR